MRTEINLDTSNKEAEYNKYERIQVNIKLVKTITEEDYKTIKEAIEALEKIARDYIEVKE